MFKVKDCNFGRVTLSSAKGEGEIEFLLFGGDLMSFSKGDISPEEKKEMEKAAKLILGLREEVKK